MTSSSTTRRVLGDLNVNTPPASAPRAGTPKALLHGKNHGYGGSPVKLGREGQEESVKYTYLLDGSASRTAAVAVAVEGDGSLTMGLREGGCYASEADENSPKRRKIESASESVRECESESTRVEEDVCRPAMGSSRGSSPSGSPCSSSFANVTIDMNDTQNTVITEPDSVPFAFTAPATTRHPSVSLSQEDFREKARAIRLRLSLASYKVRTNQINVPMSRLEIRSSPFSQKFPSFPRTISNSSSTSTSTTGPRLRTTLPSGSTATAPAAAAINTPNKTHPARPSKLAQQSYAADDITSSPPPFHTDDRSMSPTKDTDGPTREGYATPILPRQREGLLYPPQLGSPSGNDLTSSVVKGRAANGLLSLMRQLE